MTGYLGLGSNEGDRLGLLRAARERLATRGIEVTASSSVYETAPQGEILDQPDFLNAVVRIETDLDPADFAAGVRVQTFLNGEVVQDGSTKDLVFDIPTLVAHVSSCMTLLPGDVILTGTPEGVGPMLPGPYACCPRPSIERTGVPTDRAYSPLSWPLPQSCSSPQTIGRHPRNRFGHAVQD